MEEKQRKKGQVIKEMYALEKNYSNEYGKNEEITYHGRKN